MPPNQPPNMASPPAYGVGDVVWVRTEDTWEALEVRVVNDSAAVSCVWNGRVRLLPLGCLGTNAVLFCVCVRVCVCVCVFEAVCV